MKEVFRQSASLNTCRRNASTCTSGIPGDSTHVKNTCMNFSHVWQKRVKQDHCDNANFPKFIKDRLSKLAVVICNRKTYGIDFRSYRSLDDRHWIFFFFLRKQECFRRHRLWLWCDAYCYCPNVLPGNFLAFLSRKTDLILKQRKIKLTASYSLYYTKSYWTSFLKVSKII